MNAPVDPTDEHGSAVEQNSWRLLAQFLTTRTLAPLNQFTYWAYLFVAVIGAGALGVWVEILRVIDDADDDHVKGLITAIFTYFPALACASSMQLVIGPPQRHVRSFAILAMAVLTLIGVFHLAGRFGNTAAIIWGSLASLFSIYLWWVANALDDNLRDVPYNATMGGDVHNDPKGDIDGFTS